MYIVGVKLGKWLEDVVYETGCGIEDGVTLGNDGTNRRDASELLMYFRDTVKLRDLWMVGGGEEEGVQSLVVVVQLWFKTNDYVVDVFYDVLCWVVVC